MPLKGHSMKIKCFQRFISLPQSKSRLCQPSEIIFLSLIPVFKDKICRKTFGLISIFNTLLFLCFVVGKQRLQFSLLSAGWSLVSVDWFVVCPSSNWVWTSCCIGSFMCPWLTATKRNNWLYLQFLFSVLDSNMRLWLTSWSVVCGWFELHLSLRNIRKCWWWYECSF